MENDTTRMWSTLVLHDNGLGWFVVGGAKIPDLELTGGTGRENLHLHSAGEGGHSSIVSIIWKQGGKETERERGRERERERERERGREEGRERHGLVCYLIL